MKRKMIITICGVVILGSFLACNNDKRQSSTSNKSPDVPRGWSLGKGNEFIPKTKAEKNLVAQHSTYQSALFLGNTDELKRFFYKESLEYYKKFYPDYSLDEILDDFLSTISGDATKMLREYEDNGITFSIYIEDVVREVEYGNDLLYVYNVCGRLEGYIDDTLTYLHTEMPDITLGISHNKGKNWTFMSMTNEVPSILLMNYPQNIVDDVMGY